MTSVSAGHIIPTPTQPVGLKKQQKKRRGLLMLAMLQGGPKISTCHTKGLSKAVKASVCFHIKTKYCKEFDALYKK